MHVVGVWKKLETTNLETFHILPCAANPLGRSFVSPRFQWSKTGTTYDEIVQFYAILILIRTCSPSPSTRLIKLFVIIYFYSVVCTRVHSLKANHVVNYEVFSQLMLTHGLVHTCKYVRMDVNRMIIDNSVVARSILNEN